MANDDDDTVVVCPYGYRYGPHEANLAEKTAVLLAELPDCAAAMHRSYIDARDDDDDTVSPPYSPWWHSRYHNESQYISFLLGPVPKSDKPNYSTDRKESGWCGLVRTFGNNWPSCEGVFRLLNSETESLACEHTIDTCRTCDLLISDSTWGRKYLPVAAVCLPANCKLQNYSHTYSTGGCDKGFFCEMPNSQCCGLTQTPISVTYNTLQPPWAPVIQLGHGLISAILSPPFHFHLKASIQDRLPLVEYAGANLQAFLLLRSLYLLKEAVKQVQDPVCGWLVFNFASLFGPAVVSFTQICGVLISVYFSCAKDPQLDWNDPVIYPLSRIAAKVFLFFPWAVMVLYVIVIGCGCGVATLGFTSIPGFAALLHMWLVLGAVLTIVTLVMGTFGLLLTACFGAIPNEECVQTRVYVIMLMTLHNAFKPSVSSA
jgi:hypothetical protein